MSNPKIKSGYRVKTDAQTLFDELERIRDGGDLEPQKVVDESADEDAPLHPEFEWDDSVAANLHRINEARYLIRAVETVHPEVGPVRVYESVTVEATDDEPKAQRFNTVENIMEDPDRRAQMLAQAIRDAAAFRRRYKNLQELAKVFASLDDFLKTADV